MLEGWKAGKLGVGEMEKWAIGVAALETNTKNIQ
jgi:hypothetical protein